MKPISMTIILLAAAIISSCAAPGTINSPGTETPLPSTATISPPTQTLPLPSATQPTVRATKTPRFKVVQSLTQAPVGGSLPPNPYPLSEAGPYLVGKRTFTAEDSSRPARKISISVWYPALGAEGQTSIYPVLDAEPDPSGAPYPLMLSSTKLANTFAPYMVSHGFTWASIDGIDTYEPMGIELIQQPLDILFALNEVATNPPEGLGGMFDYDHAGAMGYSFDGYNALALSGARVDPGFYLGLCKDPIETKQNSSFWFDGSYHCPPALKWDQYVAAAGERSEQDQASLWQPLGDERIKAVMPMACEGWWLFGEKGLAAVEVPALFLAATNDLLYPENALIFEHLGSKEKTFITILNRDHMIVYDPEMLLRMRHFATTFFGYHLQGREDYAQYFSQDFVNGLDGMLWGVSGED